MPFQEKSLINENIYAKLLGAFIRLHRKNEGMSVTFMADTVKISKAYLSDLEHGKHLPKAYALAQILKTLGVKFNDDKCFKEFLSDKLNFLYNHFMNMDEVEEASVYIETFLLDDNYEFSYGFLQFYLITFMKLIRSGDNDNKIEYIMNVLDYNIELLTNKEKAIYYNLLSIIDIQTRNYKLAIINLNNGLEVLVLE